MVGCRVMRFVRVLGPVVVLSAALFAGCNTAPTLPLPPPVASVNTPDMQGFALVEGEVNELAYVFVFNENRDAGVITRADESGAFSVKIRADVGDHLTIWQEFEGDVGERKESVVPGM
jgi:hypothetical protein